MTNNQSETIEVFISYSKQDKELRDGLLSHLRPLENEGIISWYDRQILPGTKWDDEIKARLNSADIILLLISADFLATDYCTKVEIPEALRRHQAGEVTVMPVILRQCAWKYTDLAKIQAYPEKAKPIKSWTDIDEAFSDVVDGVYLAAAEIKKQRQAAQERQQEEQRKLTELASERGVDYTQLEMLLKAGQWKAADQETAKRMCEVMGRQQENWFRDEDLQNFPCTDLHTIDHLWVKHSKNQFGFSIQKKNWQDCYSLARKIFSWESWCETVGWKKKGKGLVSDWLSYSELTFDLSAPQGHLPCSVYFVLAGLGGVGTIQELEGDEISSLSRRLVDCSR